MFGHCVTVYLYCVVLHTVHCAECRALLSGLLAAAARSEDCAVAVCRRISSLEPLYYRVTIEL